MQPIGDVLRRAMGITPSEPKCMGCLKPSRESWCPECRQKEREREASERAHETARRTLESIPEAYRWAAFGVSDLVQRVNPPDMVQFARKLIDAPSVILAGGGGGGKTSLGCALLRAMSAKRRQVGLFVDTFDLAKARREQRLGQGESPLIVSACRAPILLLDELGAEEGRDTSVDEVIRSRWNSMLPTIYTTGFSMEELKAKYGDAVYRRISERGSWIHVIARKDHFVQSIGDPHEPTRDPRLYPASRYRG